ncbi:MAG: hypothetical protein ABI895_05450 [Deltaproteobacteria bacterium]
MSRSQPVRKPTTSSPVAAPGESDIFLTEEPELRAPLSKEERFEAAKEKVFRVHAELFRRLAE